MLLICYGTRPELLKVKPIIDELERRGIKNYLTLFTGQHKDLVGTNPTYSISIYDDGAGLGVDRLSNVLVSCVEGIATTINLSSVKITHVMVQGDTTSAMAIAIGAFHNKVKVIHLEAGLRTFDNENPFPEEANRQIISRITDIHLCPTIDNLVNLRGELHSPKAFVVGNTGLDNLINLKEKCSDENVILVTLHRRENHEIMDKWFKAVNDIAIACHDIRFILPLHPNPKVQEHKYLLTNVDVIDPLPHDEMMNWLCKSKLVITDSGGLQEECSYLNKMAVVCRKATERPEAIGLTTIMCPDPEYLYFNVMELLIGEKYKVKNENSPFGDGFASKKVVDLLLKEKIVGINAKNSEHSNEL